MYIFGGKDSNSQKLNDLWAFDLESSTWTLMQPIDRRSPDPRSGHTACYYEGYILVFGGILEVTKELNDV
jgi:N-acetylneuraminic acid mutarotase